MPRTVLALSGGVDSAVLLWHLRKQGHTVDCVVLDFGQPADIAEVAAAERLIRELKLDGPRGGLVSLTEVPIESVPFRIKPDSKLRPFAYYGLLVAGVLNMHALAKGADCIAFGLRLDTSLSAVGKDAHDLFSCLVPTITKSFVSVYCPFKEKTKAQIIQEGHRLKVPFEHTWSCIDGNEQHCGMCYGCRQRKVAFADAKVRDYAIFAGEPTILKMPTGEPHEEEEDAA